MSARNQLQLVVLPLRHRKQLAVLDLIAVDLRLGLQVVGAQRLVKRARVDHKHLADVGEQRHDVISVVVELDQQLSVGSAPDSDCAFFASRQDVVFVGEDARDFAFVSDCDFPQDCLRLGVEAPDEAVSPA